MKQHDLIKIARQAASAVIALEESDIVHRDIAARNFLVDAGFHVKLSDFGMSRQVHASEGGEYNAKNNAAIPVRW